MYVFKSNMFLLSTLTAYVIQNIYLVQLFLFVIIYMYLPLMNNKGIFVFGSKIFPETPRDAISSLPLELSWKIFSYLDDSSLRAATHVYKVWNRIILSHKSLRRRLNAFELAMTLGSKSLAQFYKNSKRRRVKKGTRKNFLAVGECTVQSMKKTVYKSKRGAEEFVIRTKRFKLF